MKFTLNPMPGEAGFIQWKDAMKALTRLPGGVPKEFRKSVSRVFLIFSRVQLIHFKIGKIIKNLYTDMAQPFSEVYTRHKLRLE